MIKQIIASVTILFLSSCSMFNNKNVETNEKKGLGERHIGYYADKTVNSLEVPPDLTKPNSQNSFKLSKYASNIPESVVSFANKEQEQAIVKNSNTLIVLTDIKVKKSGNRRWLVVDKDLESVWTLTRNFLTFHGFVIKKSNKQIGIMETDFLENYPEISDQSLGFIRSMLGKVLKTRYTLPIADKYRVRIEPATDSNKIEVYLSLTSMAEVITGSGSRNENTIWQSHPKDEALETEMLYRLMVFLGSNQAAAKNAITNAEEDFKIAVRVEKSIGGYAKLVFPLGQYDTWSRLGWAFDQLSINVVDKDVKEGSFYISLAKTADKGLLSRIFDDEAIKKSFQIIVKRIDADKTEVYFNDLSEENEQATIDFSYEIFDKIAKQF